jgi:hypothetical protein
VTAQHRKIIVGKSKEGQVPHRAVEQMMMMMMMMMMIMVMYANLNKVPL